MASRTGDVLHRTCIFRWPRRIRCFVDLVHERVWWWRAVLVRLVRSGCGGGYGDRMTAATIGSARIAPAFHPPAVPTLTEQSLAAVGLPLEPFAQMTIELVRASAKGKWHVPGTGIGRCSHLTRAFGYGPASLPEQQVNVLGELDMCSACAGGVRLPGPAGALHVAAGLVVATATWVTELERLAGAMS